MTVIAAAGGAVLPLLLLLACPLMMIFMMRGMHGHGGRTESQHGEDLPEPLSLDDLKRERDALDVRIEQREETERAGIGGERR